MNFSNLDPNKHYLLSGATLAALSKEQKFLRRGGHIQPGPGVRIRTAGQAGLTISASGPASPPAAPSKPTPYQGANASDAIAGKVTVRYGWHNNLSPTIGGVPLNPPYGTAIPKLTLGNSDTAVYVEFDFTFDTTGIITSYTLNSVLSTGSAVPISALTFASDGSGTGKFYQTLFAVRVNPPAMMGGQYSVSITQAIFGCQTFQICGTGLVYSVVAS
jgi:hypothetical protein